MSAALSPLTRGVLLGFAGFLSYTFSDTSVKLIEGRLSPYESAFIGAAIGLLCLPALKLPGERMSDMLRTVNRPLWLIRFVSYPAGVIGSVTAFTHLSMAEAFVLIFLMPSYITIIGLVWLKERVDARGWAALVIGFLGVLIVLRPGFRELSIGHLGAVVGGLGGAVSVLSARAVGARETRVSMLGAGLLGGTAIGGLIALPSLVWPSAAEWAMLAGYGLLAVLGTWLVTKAALCAPGAYVGTTQYSQMLWAIVIDYVLFGTGIDLPMLMGIVLIVGSGLLTLIGPGRR
ncbi:DMT family transporter [Paenirhodobacter enshiensis]|uniref:DMT family transporter n=1 Tax=Paenirhodobacter enshiensis TaxID=1105367 RepID=UPI003FA1C8EF